MFGVCATVKRTKSLDTPSNVTNQLQSFDDNDPYYQKENFVLDDNTIWLDEGCCHNNTPESHSVTLHDTNTGCHGNAMATTWRTGGIKRSVQLFNSPYLDDNGGDSPVVVCSNKRTKTVSTHDAVTMPPSIVTRSKPLRSNCYGNKVSD